MKTLFAALAVVVLPSMGFAKTYSFPHVLEVSGRITSPNSSDTQIMATYSGAGRVTVDIFLYSGTDGRRKQPLLSATSQPVCNPCSFNLGLQKRVSSLALEDAIISAGGFTDRKVGGFAIIVVGGENPERVTLQGVLTETGASVKDIKVTKFNPVLVAD